MTTINLKDFYPWYTQNEYTEVSDEVAEELRANKRYEAAYRRRVTRNKAQYTNAAKITKRMAGELIDHIDVYQAEKQDGVTTQRVVIHYNCIGAFDVPDRRKIPEADIIMETRKGVAVSYAPAV